MDFSEKTALLLMDHKAKLAKKLLAVMAAVENIPKNGWNENQEYHFVEEADVSRVIRQELLKVAVSFNVAVVGIDPVVNYGRDGRQMLRTVRLVCTFTDSETGYSESFQWAGDGGDGGDKGIYKAITSAIKYFLSKTFLIPTGDDVEREKKQPQTQKPTGATKQKPQASAGPSKPQPQRPAGQSVQPPNEWPEMPVDSKAILDMTLEWYTEQAKVRRPGFRPDFVKLATAVIGHFKKWPSDKVAGPKAIKAAVPLDDVIIPAAEGLN